MQTPTQATEAVGWPCYIGVAGIPAGRTLRVPAVGQKNVISDMPGQDFRNLWLDAASVRIKGLQSPSREPMPTYPFSNTELPFRKLQIPTHNLVSLCLHVATGSS